MVYKFDLLIGSTIILFIYTYYSSSSPRLQGSIGDRTPHAIHTRSLWQHLAFVHLKRQSRFNYRSAARHLWTTFHLLRDCTQLYFSFEMFFDQKCALKLKHETENFCTELYFIITLIKKALNSNCQLQFHRVELCYIFIIKF